MAAVVVITGTPGSGKTTLAKALSRKIKGSKLIGVNEIVKREKLFSSYASDGARVVKMKALKKELEREIKASKGSIIIEGHLLCEMRIKGARVIVVREHLEKIKRRLLKRGYLISKVRDNVVSEAIDYCGQNARKNYKQVFEVVSGEGSVAAALRIIKTKPKKQNTVDMLGELAQIIKKDKRFVM